MNIIIYARIVLHDRATVAAKEEDDVEKSLTRWNLEAVVRRWPGPRREGATHTRVLSPGQRYCKSNETRLTNVRLARTQTFDRSFCSLFYVQHFSRRVNDTLQPPWGIFRIAVFDWYSVDYYIGQRCPTRVKVAHDLFLCCVEIKIQLCISKNCIFLMPVKVLLCV